MNSWPGSGLGGFHLEKIVNSCISKFLEESGVENVFVRNEIFGPRVVKTVMNGGHYVRGKHGTALILEDFLSSGCLNPTKVKGQYTLEALTLMILQPV